MGEVVTVGLDLAKLIFQAHGADAAGRVVFRNTLRRAKVLEFFGRLSPCVVATEACAGAHHWGREIAKLWKPDTAGAVARNEALRTSRRLGRTIWRRWSSYHRRSRAETKMHCVKLLGQRLASRDFDRQVAEFQVRVAVLNGFTALGMPVTEVAG